MNGELRVHPLFLEGCEPTDNPPHHPSRRGNGRLVSLAGRLKLGFLEIPAEMLARWISTILRRLDSYSWSAALASRGLLIAPSSRRLWITLVPVLWAFTIFHGTIILIKQDNRTSVITIRWGGEEGVAKFVQRPL